MRRDAPIHAGKPIGTGPSASWGRLGAVGAREGRTLFGKGGRTLAEGQRRGGSHDRQS
jgi:hypothetical protein